MRTAISLALAITISAAPAVAPADAFKPSKTQQVSLGKRAAAEVNRKEKLVPASDRRVQKLREIADNILRANPDAKREPWEFSFNLIDNKQMNAFALPGGPIYFYTGLFDKFKTEDQIAGVLAHEITHIKKEHWAYSYADQQKRALGLTALLLIFKVGRTGSDIANITNDLVLTLPYIRRHETEADDRGFDWMIKAGYNPQGIVEAFQVLMGGARGSKPPEFLSTHPDTAKRIKRLQEKVAKQTQAFGPQRPVPWGI